MAEPSLEFTYKGGPLYVPPPQKEEDPYDPSILELIETQDEVNEDLRGEKTPREKIVDSPVAVTSGIAGERLLSPIINKGIDKLPPNSLRASTGAIQRVLPSAGRLVFGNVIPGMGTYMLAQEAMPHVREQSYQHIDNVMDKGALVGSHPSYFDDEALKVMASQGDGQAQEILFQRTQADGILRPFRTEQEKLEDSKPDVYDNIEASIQSSADSMGSPLTAEFLPPPEFSSDEEFNKYDLDGSGMLSQDEIQNYRNRAGRHVINLDDL